MEGVQETATVEPVATPLTAVGGLSVPVLADPLPLPELVKYANAAKPAASAITRTPNSVSLFFPPAMA